MSNDENRDNESGHGPVYDQDVEAIRARRLKAALRSFIVKKIDGTTETVFGHYYDNTNTPGHLNIYTVEPGDRHAIRRTFNAREWKDLIEVEDETASRAMADLVTGRTGLPRTIVSPKKDQSIN